MRRPAVTLLATAAATAAVLSTAGPASAAPAGGVRAAGVAASAPKAAPPKAFGPAVLAGRQVPTGAIATGATLGLAPSAASVGVAPGSALRRTGSIVVRKPYTVLRNLNVYGTITIAANHVTVRNVLVRNPTAGTAIRTVRGYHHTVVEWSTITNGFAGVCADAGVNAGTYGVVQFNNIAGCADGVKASNYSLVRWNYIHMTRLATSKKHLDGIQASGTRGYTIRGNRIYQPASVGSNSAIFLQSFNGSKDVPVSGVRIFGNWLDGGNFTVMMEDGKRGSGYLSDVAVYGNTFGRQFRYGPKHTEGRVAWSASNTWYAGGSIR